MRTATLLRHHLTFQAMPRSCVCDQKSSADEYPTRHTHRVQLCRRATCRLRLGGTPADFDNVSLNVVNTSEPSFLALLAVGILTALALSKSLKDGARSGIHFEMFGARKRTRTSTTVRPLAPEASASASSAIRAQQRKIEAIFILSAWKPLCQRSHL